MHQLRKEKVIPRNYLQFSFSPNYALLTFWKLLKSDVKMHSETNCARTKENPWTSLAFKSKCQRIWKCVSWMNEITEFIFNHTGIWYSPVTNGDNYLGLITCHSELPKLSSSFFFHVFVYCLIYWTLLSWDVQKALTH
jgi:hypothetical protein